jgi:hypothetical protein
MEKRDAGARRAHYRMTAAREAVVREVGPDAAYTRRLRSRGEVPE